MVTYKDSGLIYFYDINIKSWTIYRHDNMDFQDSECEYFNDKKQLNKSYPYLKYIKWNQLKIDIEF